jgi:hypothetical protein
LSPVSLTTFSLIQYTVWLLTHFIHSWWCLMYTIVLFLQFLAYSLLRLIFSVYYATALLANSLNILLMFGFVLIQLYLFLRLWKLMFKLSLHKIHTACKVYHDKRPVHTSLITETSRLVGRIISTLRFWLPR